LKVTLFAPLFLSPYKFLRQFIDLDWVQVGVHGFYHTPRECQMWGGGQVAYCCSYAEPLGFAKVFRPPQWAFNYDAIGNFKKDDWIFAGHHQHNELKTYSGRVYYGDSIYLSNNVINTYERVHGHLTENINNSIDVIYTSIIDNYRDAEFKFITEVV